MITIGIDLGGTNIKAAVVDENSKILAEQSRPTALPRPAEAVCDDIVLTCEDALRKAGLTWADISGIGVGCPGTIDNETGLVRYSNNLDWHNFEMRKYLFEKTGFMAAMGNDANVAALGEVVAGCAKGAEDAVIVTLGTGVGSGVVLGGKILTGYGGGAAEIGHMVITDGGPRCTCGRPGCFEVWSSATGLIRMTKEAIEEHPESGLARLAAKHGKVSGRTAFDAMRQGDATGKAVVDKYIHYLGVGLTNIVNTFQPEVVALSGGISNEGESLMIPLREQVARDVFGGFGSRPTRFEICTLGNRAGVIGAAALARQESTWL